MSDEFALREGEHVVRRQPASADGKSLWGGTLVLTLRDGSRVVIGVVASRFTPNFSRRNLTARDEVVDLINVRLGGDGSG